MNNKPAGDGDLRGSAPIMSTKDILLEVRDDVKDMKRNVDILVSQDLDSRITNIELWKARVSGSVIAIAAAVSAAVSVGTLLVSLHLIS